MVRALLTFAFILLLRIGMSQHYPSIAYNNRDGLVQMQVTDTFEDSRGYIWIGTKFGISKFDGSHFENFTIKDGLKQIQFEGFTEDSQHNIWVKYIYSWGFAKFDGHRFKNISTQKAVYSSIVDYKNEVIFARNDSLFVVKNDSAYFKKKLPFKTKEAFASIELIVERQTGILYLLHNQGLTHDVYYFDDAKNTFIRFYHINADTFIPYHIRNNILIQTGNGNESAFYSLKNKKIEKYFSISPTKTEFKRYPDFNFNFTFNGKSWLYVKYDKTISKISDILGGHTTTSNYHKENQKLYVGTEKGLICVFLNGFKYFPENEVPYAWGVAEDNKKNMWFASYEFPLQKFDKKTIQTIKSYYPQMLSIAKKNTQNTSEQYFNNWYFSPLRDKYGKVWLPKLLGALIIDNGKMDYWQPDKPFFFSQMEDPKRNKIIGCGFGGIGVVENKTPYKYEFVTDTTDLFRNNALILTAALDKNGNYWLGGRDIAKYNPDTKTFTYYTAKNGKLAKRGIGNITIDSFGGIWACTFYDGLLKLNPRTDKFERVFLKYFSEDNASSAYLGQMNERYFVVADKRNLNIIDLKEYYATGKENIVKRLNINNGFLGLEPGQDGFYKDSEGKIWVTSSTVLSYFDPKKINFEQEKIHTYIRVLNGNRLPFNYEQQPAFELPYNINTFRLEVESVGEDISAEPQFSYRIKGFVNEWTDWQKGREIFLMNLPSGKYTIEIRSKHSVEEDTNHSTTFLKFRVSIPFWKSPNFYQYAFWGFLLLITIMGIIWYRAYMQSRNIRKQKQLAQEQTKLINMLQVKTSQSQLNPHFIYNVMTTLQNRILLNKPLEASENLGKLSHLIRSILNANQFENNSVTSFIKLEITIEEEIGLLRSYIEFELLQRKNFDYEIIVEPSIEPENYKIQPMLLQPFVENAIKHGFNELKGQGNLKIKFWLDADEAIVCEIDDNGIGREKAREIQRKSIGKYKSLGTDLVMNRIEILKSIGYDITVAIEDKLQGTKVTLKIKFDGE